MEGKDGKGGRTDGWMGVWMDGWKAVWKEGRIRRRKEGRKAGEDDRKDRGKFKEMKWKGGKGRAGREEGRMDGWMDGSIKGRKEG